MLTLFTYVKHPVIGVISLLLKKDFHHPPGAFN